MMLKRQRKDPSPEGDQSPNQHSEKTKPEAPSHSIRHYNHPSEEEHRTAEQFNWRDGYRLNVGIAVVAVIGAVFAFGSFVESKRQADLSSAEQRPWVRTEVEITSDLHYFPGMESSALGLTYKLHNVGLTPAVFATALAIGTPIFQRSGLLGDMPKSVCDRLAANARTIPRIGQTIFANEVLPKPGIADDEAGWDVSKLTPDQILNDDSGSGVNLFVYGCVVYFIGQQTDVHRTPFLYEVWRIWKRPGQADGLTHILPMDKSIPKENLRLVPLSDVGVQPD